MSENLFLVRAVEAGWLVDHNGEPVALHTSQAAAVADAVERARPEDAEVMIRVGDGTVDDGERFGHYDPGEGKG